MPKNTPIHSPLIEGILSEMALESERHTAIMRDLFQRLWLARGTGQLAAADPRDCQLIDPEEGPE